MNFKNKLKLIIYTIIRKVVEIIEKIEYRYKDINEDDISKKILNTLITNKTSVKTDTGYEVVSHIHITQPYQIYRLKTRNFKLDCADNHIVFKLGINGLEEVYVKDLKVNDRIYTTSGYQLVLSIEKMRYKCSMFDLTVDSDNHRYFTNGILSHNTVTSSITILHYALFNNTKNILVTANKLETVTEILDKIKEMYYRLPFFLQQGVKTMNNKVITFENKSRIKGFATSKTASIGNTADFLYMDEFAYVPDNIADKFYKSIIPTVANIDNSKIIITSTPNGYNLFHRLLIEAEKPEGEKSSFKAHRVYWYQVPKRFVTYLRLNSQKMEYYGINKNDILEKIKEIYPNNLNKDKDSQIKWDSSRNKWVIDIFNDDYCTEDKIRELVLNIDVYINGEKTTKEIRIVEIADISTWKKDAIIDIGGEDNFNQEYNLQFTNNQKTILGEKLLSEIMDGSDYYEYRDIDVFDKLPFLYTSLTWYKNYNHAGRFNDYITISVDISEGLGLDYSVINIFSLGVKPFDLIENNIKRYKNITDMVQLFQIGTYRSNITSVEQLALILYTLIYEYFDSEKVKVVLEMNTYGHTLIKDMKNLYDMDNDFGTNIFYKYSHRVDSMEESIGIRINDNKPLLVKKYEERLTDRSIKITDKITAHEVNTFIKKVSSNGSIRYGGEGNSNDDLVMTIVTLSTVFDKYQFELICDEYLSELSTHSTIVSKYYDILTNNYKGDEDSMNFSETSSLIRNSINSIRNSNSNINFGLGRYNNK